MSVNIKSLGLSDSRQIRETINTPQGVIEVYEPTMQVVGAIIDMQHELGFGMDSDTVSFTGAEVIKNLFPLVTNINLEGLSDEELQKVIDNPSVYLLTTQQYVAQIVSEANKLYAERIKTELMNTESAVAQMDLIQSIPQMIVERAKVDGNVAELMEKVDEAGEALDEAIEKERAKSRVEEAEIKITPDSYLDNDI